MSEPLLKSILRLFAVVATQDDLTYQERVQIENFLDEHLSQSAKSGYLQFFDDYAKNLTSHGGDLKLELNVVEELTNEIGPELTQKQKVVILLELIRIVMADEVLSSREE